MPTAASREVCQFYPDLGAPNRMDAKPFPVLDFAALDETLLPELAILTRESFDLDFVIGAAGELKYIGQQAPAEPVLVERRGH